jgi:hypothetical protein
MLNKIGKALYFLFSAGAIVLIFALVAGLVYLVAFDVYPLSWNLLSGSLFFIILAGIFWVCAQVSWFLLTDEDTSPSDRSESS